MDTASKSISIQMQQAAEEALFKNYNTSSISEDDSRLYEEAADKERTKDIWTYQTELFDEISAPKHYARWKVQPIEFINANSLEFWRGNVIKYVMRAGFKGEDWEEEIKDLEKAKEYCDMRIKDIKGEPLV